MDRKYSNGVHCLAEKNLFPHFGSSFHDFFIQSHQQCHLILIVFRFKIVDEYYLHPIKMDAMTLPADWCVFGRDDCRSGGSKFHPSSHAAWKIPFYLYLVSCEQTRFRFEESFRVNTYGCKIWCTGSLPDVSFLTDFQLRVTQNDFVDVFDAFQCSSLICASRAFSIICICATAFEFIKLVTHGCFRLSRFVVTVFKSYKKQCFINAQKSWFPS